MAPRHRRVHFDHPAVLCVYKAHIRSVTEYANVIWSGASQKNHLVRFGRLQNRYLMWLWVRTRSQWPPPPPPDGLDSLMSHFKPTFFRLKFMQADIPFMCSLFSCRPVCAFVWKKSFNFKVAPLGGGVLADWLLAEHLARTRAKQCCIE